MAAAGTWRTIDFTAPIMIFCVSCWCLGQLAPEAVDWAVGVISWRGGAELLLRAHVRTRPISALSSIANKPTLCLIFWSRWLDLFIIQELH